MAVGGVWGYASLARISTENVLSSLGSVESSFNGAGYLLGFEVGVFSLLAVKKVFSDLKSTSTSWRENIQILSGFMKGVFVGSVSTVALIAGRMAGHYGHYLVKGPVQSETYDAVVKTMEGRLHEFPLDNVVDGLRTPTLGGLLFAGGLMGVGYRLIQNFRSRQ